MVKIYWPILLVIVPQVRVSILHKNQCLCHTWMYSQNWRVWSRLITMSAHYDNVSKISQTGENFQDDLPSVISDNLRLFDSHSRALRHTINFRTIRLIFCCFASAICRWELCIWNSAHHLQLYFSITLNFTPATLHICWTQQLYGCNMRWWLLSFLDGRNPDSTVVVSSSSQSFQVGSVIWCAFWRSYNLFVNFSLFLKQKSSRYLWWKRRRRSRIRNQVWNKWWNKCRIKISKCLHLRDRTESTISLQSFYRLKQREHLREIDLREINRSNRSRSWSTKLGNYTVYTFP